MEQAKLHPLLITAAVAVLLFSLLGAAAITGVLPRAISKSAPETVVQRSAAAAPKQVAAASTPKPKEVAEVARATACVNCGTIESVQTVEVKGAASGLGAVAGGVTGALVGNQIGGGSGKTVMTIAGAAGGAYAGNEIEKNMKKSTAYRVTIRMDDGTTRKLSYPAPPAYAVGERVRIVNGSALERV